MPEMILTPEAAKTSRRRRSVVSDNETLLCIDDLAKYLGISRRTCESMRSAGKLLRPDLIIGKRSPRWKRESVNAWIDRQGSRQAG